MTDTSPDELAAEISRLEVEEAALSRVRKRLHDRIDGGLANESTHRQEREVSDQRRELHRRIDALRAQLDRIDRA